MVKSAMPERVESSNILIIGEKDVSIYAWAMLLIGQPMTYSKFGEIKIQVARNRLERANRLIELFKSWGLEETDRQPCKILVTPPNRKSYYLPDAYEITLKKIGALLSW